jgi:hypothetical protein
MADDAIQLTLKTIATGTGVQDTIAGLAKVNTAASSATKGMTGLTQEIEKQMKLAKQYGSISNTMAATQGSAFNRALGQFMPSGVVSGNLANNPLIAQLLQPAAMQTAWSKNFNWAKVTPTSLQAMSSLGNAT